jgi:hypothetical protein
MLDQVTQILYGYILQAEMLFLRYYKVDPFQIMKGIPLVDLQVYVKQIEEAEKKERESFKKKDLMTALRQICEILNYMFYKKT